MKLLGKATLKSPKRSNGNERQKKIEAILWIIKEIYDGARRVAQLPWARKGEGKRIEGSAKKLYHQMRQLADNNDLEGMFNYVLNARRSPAGKRIGLLLEESNEKSIESEFERIRRIYYDQ